MEEKCKIVINKQENLVSFRDIPVFRLFVYYGKLCIKTGVDRAICIDSAYPDVFSGSKMDDYVMAVKKVEVTV